MRRTRLRSLAIALLGLPLLASCADEGDTPLEPAIGGDLFDRYVALGNSITAGYQSGGINDSLQQRSYAVLLAEKAGAQFNYPAIAMPGCPRPYLSPLGGAGRVGENDSCVRINTPRILNNVAIPGETIGDLLELQTEGLHGLMIGPRTQLEAMLAADPTLVSLWIGNNDALGSAVAGTTALLTPANVFAAAIDEVAATIEQADPQGAVLVGVVDPNVVPLLQPGAFYYLAYAGALAQGQDSPFGRPVSQNCAPGAPGANNQVSLAILGTSPQDVPVISCEADAPLVLSTAESQVVSERVAAFNAAIAAEAAERDWIYLNPNTMFAQALADPSMLRKCQGLATLTPGSTPAEIGTAIATTCPALSDPSVGFGALISFDGVHPSTLAHEIVANTLAELINDRYDVTLPTS